MATDKTADPSVLAQQVAALEAENARLHTQLAAATSDRAYQQFQLFLSLAERALDGIIVTMYDEHDAPYLAYINAAFKTMLGYGDDFKQADLAHINALDSEIYANAPRIAREQGWWRGKQVMQKRDGTPLQMLISAYYYYLDEAQQHTPVLAAVFRDITDLHESEQARARLQANLIETQESLIRELSTPLIPIADDVVIMPLIGSLDTARAQAIIETLLTGIAAHRAQTAILDITGVQTIDTHVASTLVQAAQSVRLLGSRVMITGIHPAIAQTLVQLGVELQDIATYGTLQDGIAAALRRTRTARSPTTTHRRYNTR